MAVRTGFILVLQVSTQLYMHNLQYQRWNEGEQFNDCSFKLASMNLNTFNVLSGTSEVCLKAEGVPRCSVKVIR